MKLCANQRFKPRLTQRIAAFPLAALLAFGLVLGTSGQMAHANDEDNAWDIRILRNVIRSLGLRDGTEAGIEYRERSPLVLPPSRSLPSPEEASAAASNPQWPVDVDLKRAQERQAVRRAPRRSIDEESLPELPQQLDRVGRSQGPQEPGTFSDRNPVDPLPPSALGARSLFSRGGLFAGQREEYATFTGEPPRQRLTQPPPGYRTPSPAQPYGVGKEQYKPQAINPLDTPAMRGQQ